MNRLLHRRSRRGEALSDFRLSTFDLRASRQAARISCIVCRKLLRLLLGLVALSLVLLTNLPAWAEQRFPPPDFSETGHQLPVTTTPPARAEWLQYVDVAVLAACLGVALCFIYQQRSRRGLFWLGIFSLAYFGFWRKGCVCAIGAPQNIILGLFDASYSVPLTVVAFFALPLVVALVAGRAFCAGACPHGALQDLLLVKPLKVPVWLEHALGVLPFIFLGFGLTFAATGTGFPICRYDPIVPIFRLNGSALMIALAALTLLLGMFVGRPYCRFLCPYGALLKLASLASKWRVRVTPDYCTQCRLCENSCPFGAMREPSSGTGEPRFLAPDRRRLGWLLLLVPLLIASGAWMGNHLGPPVSKLNPTVELAGRYVRQQSSPVPYGAMTPEALSLQRAERDPEALLKSAAGLRQRFTLACMIFGGWIGLVFGLKLVSLSLRTLRADFEPDRGACLACARCFRSCPNELVRLGLLPTSELTQPPPAAAPAKS
jgi:NosR/NirI family transcriptional regulator, nitrous oxide reductase regulator